MLTGGTAGLGIVDGSKNNFLQFLKQGMIGPKAQNLRAVVAAGEGLDYLAELKNSWPPDMPEAQELFNIIDKTMTISNLLINAGESYTEVKELTGSQGLVPPEGYEKIETDHCPCRSRQQGRVFGVKNRPHLGAFRD